MPVTIAPEENLEALAYHAGFVVEEIAPLPELAGHVVRARHPASGARFLHLRRDDPEHLFAVAFRTPPPDDTGVPHILEHTVLCGSRKFPVKDPFVELLKTSLATFLNAFTSPDHTVYPCASTNEHDFHNLMRVYLDAAFHPLLAEPFFKQEGVHLDLAPDGALVHAGIVYNEMKGAYSDLDGIMGREGIRQLYPDNIYGRDAGGDPDHIPELTYEQFLAFHKTYYHPANAWFFLHTPMATSRLMKFLNEETLSGFQTIPIDTRITPHPRWRETRLTTVDYPIAPDEEGDQTAIAFLVAANDLRDPVTTLAMKVIDHYLLANDASPLRKAIVDSRLGDDLGDSGYCAFLLDTFFEVSLKGTRVDRANTFVQLVLNTCAREVEKGFDPEKLAAAFQQAEVAAREIGAQYPLRLMERVYSQWLYDADPVEGLRQGKQLAELHRLQRKDPRFFENVLQRVVLDNPHRSIVVFTPDLGYRTARDRAYQERMKKEKAALARERLDAIARESRELADFQTQPNSPESLATLPRLALADVPVEPLPLPVVDTRVREQPLLRTDVFTGGVSVFNTILDLSDLPDDLVEALPIFATALGRMGAGDADFETMATREARWTGGIAFGAGVYGAIDDPSRLRLALKATLFGLDDNWEPALKVFADRLLKCDFTDRDHLRDVVTQTRVQVRASILSSGNSYAALHAACGVSAGARLSERLSGFGQIRHLDRLVADFDKSADALRNNFERIRTHALERRRLHAAFAGGDAAWEKTRKWCRATLDDMPPSGGGEQVGPRPVAGVAAGKALRRGMAFPSEVAFVARALPGPAYVDPDTPALLLLTSQLSFGYLWNEIRVKGGAYGARASLSSEMGSLSFSTYRDPAITRSLRAFDGVLNHIENEMDLSPAALEQAIIGTVKTLDAPLRPAQACRAAMARHLTGLTDDLRKEFRRRLFALDADAVRAAARKYFAPDRLANAPVCVLADARSLQAENDKPDTPALAIEQL